MQKSLIAAVVAVALAGCSQTGADVGANGNGTQADDAAALAMIQRNIKHKAACDATKKHHCFARVQTDQKGKIRSAAAAVSGFGPQDLQSAYNLPTNVNPGATIAIVDAFGYPNAESDLATYRSNYGLPACTVASGCLTIVNQNGQTSPLPPAPTSSDDWTVETALDLDMASSACPSCKLLLVQANTDQDDGLFIAQNAAASLGATVISDSWGGAEQAGSPSTAYESYFNHPGTGIFVASGDQGYDNGGQGPDYPSTSAYVTAVGATNLAKSSGGRGWTEKAWGPNNPLTGGGGSNCSLSIPKPSWQSSLNTSCSFRASADVAAVGDPTTGLAVYNNGPSSSGWVVVGGTSAASPFVAGVYALTGHGKDDPSFAYSHTSDYYDVTSGSNDSCGNVLCNCGTGWDGPTGIGTPNGASLNTTSCTPDCSGKQCGNDGCGGSCGTCPSGDACSAAGQCSACTPNCSGLACGDDGCGGSCGNCPSGQSCSSGQCTTGGGGGGSCHPVCSPGGPEDPSCGTCATLICSFDSACCTSSWDTTCVLIATFLCSCQS